MHRKVIQETWERLKTAYAAGINFIPASFSTNSLALSNWRLTSLHGNDLARGEVVEIPWISCVVARMAGIRIVVEHCVQAEVVEIRKRKAWTGVKEMA